MISSGVFVRRIFNAKVRPARAATALESDSDSAQYFVVPKLDERCWRGVCELERTISD